MTQSIYTVEDMRRIHMVGIKGVGMTALAEILQNKKKVISGSDIAERFFTDDILQGLDISYTEEFSQDVITQDIDVVVYSTAYDPEKNEELIEAQKKNIPIISYPEFLGILTQEGLSIAVCGTHGKTTTTAILAKAFEAAGQDPNVIVGSKVDGWNGGARSGKGEHFIFEADEYQDKLALYQPWSAILTSVDWDHPDYFETKESYENVFISFVQKIPSHGHLILNGDDCDVISVCKMAQAQKVTYGFSKECDYRIENFVMDQEEGSQYVQSFKILYKRDILGVFNMRLAGKHNALNAAAVVALCHVLKLDISKVANGIGEFLGTARRFEHVGTYKTAQLIDDYAHHPREIEATLSAAKLRYPDKRIIAVFQPHTFSRTEALFEEFAQSFEDAEKVYILDVYGSARETKGDISGDDLARAIGKYQYGKAQYVESIDEAKEVLRKLIRKDDVVISMGAGNVWEVTHDLVQGE